MFTIEFYQNKIRSVTENWGFEIAIFHTSKSYKKSKYFWTDLYLYKDTLTEGELKNNFMIIKKMSGYSDIGCKFICSSFGQTQKKSLSNLYKRIELLNERFLYLTSYKQKIEEK